MKSLGHKATLTVTVKCDKDSAAGGCCDVIFRGCRYNTTITDTNADDCSIDTHNFDTMHSIPYVAHMGDMAHLAAEGRKQGHERTKSPMKR